MSNSIKITNICNNKYAISQVTPDGQEEIIAEVFNDMDALLLAYMIEKALAKDFNEEEFKKFVVRIAPDVPFLTLPQE